LRLYRLRARRGPARCPAGTGRSRARLRREPGRDLRLLYLPLGRTDAGGARRHVGGVRALAAESRARGPRQLPLRTGGPRADGDAARARAGRTRRPSAEGRRPSRGRGMTVSPGRRLLAPVVARHVTGEFLRVFALALLAFVAIYVIVDFFDRFDSFLRHEAPPDAMVRYFIFKLPLVVTQVTPVAVLAAALVGLGLLARHNEFVALRACGVSVWQITLPLLVVAAGISVATFVWNETLVPYSARRWHTIENGEIKGREAQSLFTGRQVWYHGRAGFYNVDRVSKRHRTLYGLTIYQLGTDFRPRRQVEFDAATWDGRAWRLTGGRTREFHRSGVLDRP